MDETAGGYLIYNLLRLISIINSTKENDGHVSFPTKRVFPLRFNVNSKCVKMYKRL